VQTVEKNLVFRCEKIRVYAEIKKRSVTHNGSLFGQTKNREVQ